MAKWFHFQRKTPKRGSAIWVLCTDGEERRATWDGMLMTASGKMFTRDHTMWWYPRVRL